MCLKKSLRYLLTLQERCSKGDAREMKRVKRGIGGSARSLAGWLADWGFVCVADVVNSGANTLIRQRSQ